MSSVGDPGEKEVRALITQRETQRGEQAARSVGRETSMEDPAQRPVRPRGLVGEEGEEEGGGRKQVMCEQRSAQMEETGGSTAVAGATASWRPAHRVPAFLICFGIFYLFSQQMHPFYYFHKKKT